MIQKIQINKKTNKITEVKIAQAAAAENKVCHYDGRLPPDCMIDGVSIPEGETVEDPSSPCEACRCVGGEVVCEVIRCPWRSDCEGVHSPGVCCPSYDHCPKEGVAVRTLKFLLKLPAHPS